MGLDFSGMMDLGKKQGLETKEELKPVEQDINKKALTSLERQQYLLEEAKKVYKEYQDNIRLSEEMRIEILKATNKDPKITKDLFMKAIKIVSLLCHEPTFYNQIEKRVVE